jgi:hypothetical protein
LSFPLRFRPQKDPGPPEETVTTNISSAGISFDASRALEIGTEVKCELTLPPHPRQENDVQVECRGRVVRCAPSDDQRKVEIAATIEEYRFLRNGPS